MKNTRALLVSSLFGVIGFILMFLEFPLPFLIPSFIKFDFSDLPALICSFCFGPIYGVLACLVKNLLHLTITSTLGIGELSNFMLGAVFVLVAGFIYKKNKSKKTALIGSLIGALSMAVFSVLSNFLIIYPLYEQIGFPMEAIVGMYKLILPASDTLLKSLIIFNMPFTFAKGLIDSVICALIYKKLSPILKKQ